MRHRLRRTSDHDSRARALESLQEALGLPDAPLRIECYDMSHLQGTDYVGSMVVLEDGLPKKTDYRHFRVATWPGNDDYAAMEEVLTRRLTALLEEERPAGAVPAGDDAPRPAPGTPADGRPGRAGPPPPVRLSAATAPPRRGLGQLNVGIRVLENLGLSDRIPIASLAKSFEEVYRPGQLRADPAVPSIRGALSAPAPPRRGPPLRHLVPSHPAGQADDPGALDGVPGLGAKRRSPPDGSSRGPGLPSEMPRRTS